MEKRHSKWTAGWVGGRENRKGKGKEGEEGGKGGNGRRVKEIREGEKREEGGNRREEEIKRLKRYQSIVIYVAYLDADSNKQIIKNNYGLLGKFKYWQILDYIIINLIDYSSVFIFLRESFKDIQQVVE